MSNYAVYASIIHLLKSGRPPAIFWAIIAIIVNAVNREIGGWARPHIGIELLEDLPLFADFNASATIARIAMILWIFATLSHAPPSKPFGRVDHAVLLGSLPNIPSIITLHTAATFDVACSQITAEFNDGRSAIADAEPPGAKALFCAYSARTGISKNNKPAKTLARQILDLFVFDGNNLGYSGVGHCNLQLLCSGRGRSQKSSAAIFVPALTSIIAQMGEAH